MPERESRHPTDEIMREYGGQVFEGTPVSGTILLEEELPRVSRGRTRSTGEETPRQ